MRTFLAAIGGGLIVAAVGLPMGLLLITLGWSLGITLGFLLVLSFFG